MHQDKISWKPTSLNYLSEWTPENIWTSQSESPQELLQNRKPWDYVIYLNPKKPQAQKKAAMACAQVEYTFA